MPVVALIVSATLWGLSWWPLKYFHQQGVAALTLTLVAYGAVALVLLPRLWIERPRWREQPRLLLLMTLLGGYANLAFAQAMIHGEVVRAMMLFYLAPLWGVLGARLFLGETIDGRRWLGMGLALGGAFLVLGGWNLLDLPPSFVDLLAISAGVAFAFNNVSCRAAQRIPVGSKTAAVFLGCALMALAMMAARPAAIPSAPGPIWLWLAAFGLFWLLLATLAGNWGVTFTETGRASVILTLELAVATLSATLLGEEVLAAHEWIGGGLIFAAALLEARRAGVPQSCPTPS